MDFGLVDGNIQIRLFFPALKDKEPIELAPTIYDNCSRPALERVIAERMGHLPVDYRSEMTRTLQKTGRVIQSHYDIHCDCLRDFAIYFFDELANIEDCQGAFFGHEIRGAKNNNFHRPCPRDAADALRIISKAFDADAIVRSVDNRSATWYIDVALEVTRKGCTLLPMRSTHAQTLSTMTGITEVEAHRHLRSSRARVHEIGYVKDACGFDVEFRGDGVGPMGCVYAVAYSVEKTPTSMIERGHQAKYVTCKEFIELKRKGKTTHPDLQKLRRSFEACTNSSNSYAVRYEVRINLEHALTPFRCMPDNMYSLVYCVTNVVWW